MTIDVFFAQLTEALQEAPDFVAEAPTIMDVWVEDASWVVRISPQVIECYPGEWPGGAAPIIRCPSPLTWSMMVGSPESLEGLVASGAVTMDDSADPGFWWPRWRRMLELRLARASR